MKIAGQALALYTADIGLIPSTHGPQERSLSAEPRVSLEVLRMWLTTKRELNKKQKRGAFILDYDVHIDIRELCHQT